MGSPCVIPFTQWDPWDWAKEWLGIALILASLCHHGHGLGAAGHGAVQYSNEMEMKSNMMDTHRTTQ